jgi:hypothetical protein
MCLDARLLLTSCVYPCIHPNLITTLRPIFNESTQPKRILIGRGTRCEQRVSKRPEFQVIVVESRELQGKSLLKPRMKYPRRVSVIGSSRGKYGTSRQG